MGSFGNQFWFRSQNQVSESDQECNNPPFFQKKLGFIIHKKSWAPKTCQVDNFLMSQTHHHDGDEKDKLLTTQKITSSKRVIVLFPEYLPSPYWSPYWICTQHPTCQWSWSYLILRAIPAIHETNALREVLWQPVGKFLLKSTIALCHNFVKKIIKKSSIWRQWAEYYRQWADYCCQSYWRPKPVILTVFFRYWINLSALNQFHRKDITYPNEYTRHGGFIGKGLEIHTFHPPLRNAPTRSCFVQATEILVKLLW